MKLKLNPEKTEFIIIGDRQANESHMQKIPTQRLGNSISPINIVNNLGVTFDLGNTFTGHITKVCRACNYHLIDLRRIRIFLSVETAALLANSLISNRLDYSNSLLHGISKYNVAKLQKIQNALCRIMSTHWEVDILFLLFPLSGVWRPTWFPDILGNSSYLYQIWHAGLLG